MIDPAARARLDQWKQSLLDLSAANRLLDAPDGPTTIALPEVDLGRIAGALADGAVLALESGPPAALELASGGALASGRLRSPLAKPQLALRLTALRRAAQTQLADGGSHALWLGLGMLTWCETAPDLAALRDEPVPRVAPVALWPVELVRVAGGALRLVAAAGLAPRCNPALAEKLRRDAGAVLPGGDPLDLDALLAAAEAIAASRPGWRLEPTAQLGLFAVGPALMWCDLEAHGDELLRSPVVAQLAGDLASSRGAGFAQPSPAAVRALGGGAPTSELIAPLEADAAQLAAIAAADAGASFVLQGPPGSGKSQTIANLIVHGMATGKSVLFVSSKPAALEVVQRRLVELGLGELCLALYGAQATRATVVAQLGRVLDRVFRPAAGRSVDTARLGDLAAVLDAHVAALHRVGPFGRSLHEVLGRLVELRATPCAALAERDATGLDRPTYDRRLRAIEQLAAAAVPVEPVASHPWRASVMERWPVDERSESGGRGPAGSAGGVLIDGRDRARAALDEAAAAAAGLAQTAQAVVALVPGLTAHTRDQLQALGALAALAAVSPRPGAELLTQLRSARSDDILEKIALIRARGTGTIEAPREPASFLALAGRHRLLATEVNDRFTDSVAELDAHALWLQLRRWANRVAPLRFMALRQARAQVRAAAMPGMLETDGAMITALEAVIAERAVRAALVAAAEPAKRWFGELGGDPLGLDLARIDAAVAWAAELRRAYEAVDEQRETSPVGVGSDPAGFAGGAPQRGEKGPRGVGVARGDTGRAATWRALVAQVAANPPAESPGGGELAAFAALAAAAARWRPALAALAEATGIDAVTLGAGDDHLAALGDRIAALRHALDAMPHWVGFHAARRAALAAGVGNAVGAIERGELGADELAPAWERATLLAWSHAEIADSPALAHFHGTAHHANAAGFADRDRTALGLVRSHALVRFAERVPRTTPRADPADPVEAGELAALLHELKEPTAPRPLRSLLAALPGLLPRLAPCLAMTPAAIAEHLDPALRFDLVVIDEASQLPAAEAIGALARGTAAVIVGDSQQLPPLGWFDAGAAVRPPGRAGLLSELVQPDDPELDGAARPDSVLDACIAARLPELRLTAHYRSKHEDLFAFANRRYYGDQLQVLPAAHPAPELGLVWRRVDGVHDRAGTRQNRVEAEAVVAEVIARLRDPAQRARSLAVVALSRAQQALIEDLLDAARAGDADVDSLFEPSAQRPGEPVVVKLVDAIQGDERDVVLVSIGYGPDPDGVFITHLGPLSQPGGERRLNVAITRAREQLVVFSSFAPEDLAAAAGQGVHDLALLLAEMRDGGGLTRAARPGASEVAPASPITAAIARALAERGWAVHHQVGCGRYKLDLAVVDPNDPERYVLAIEHDGAAYASAPQARDRDRLRTQLLGQLGWRVHRIWTLDWWTEPERELQRAHGAIVTAVAANRQRKAQSAPVRASLSRAADADRPRYVSPRLGSAPTARTANGTSPPPPSGARPARPTRPPLLSRGSADGTGGETGGPTATPSSASHPGGAGHPAGRASAASAAPTMGAGSGPTDAVAALLGDTGAPVASGSVPIRLAKNTIAIGPYLAAAIPAGRRAPDDLFAPRHLGELGKIIDQVLAAEAPMHVEVLARRVGAYFGIGRLTPRVTDQVRIALAGRGRWGDENDIVWRLDQDPTGVPAVRVAGQGASARRAIEEVPLAEVAAAARIVVERAVSIPANDLVRDAARLLGFARVTERVIERVATGVRLARQRELIRIDAGKATLPD